MNSKILHGQMTVVDDSGNLQILHQETSAEDVFVDKTTNIHGANGSSVIPTDVRNAQTLFDHLGSLAFKSAIEDTDIDGNFIVVDESEEGTSVPESEINDGVTSQSLTWSSNKINSEINTLNNRIEEVNVEANSILYVTLLENASGGYTAQKSVAEIEAAYQAGKAIWIESNEVLLPLRKRTDAYTWVFSGYIGKQAYDFTITASGVTKSSAALATTNDALPNPSMLKLTGNTVNAVYDGSEEVIVDDLVSMSDVDTSISTHNTSDSAHNDIRDSITTLTNKVNNITLGVHTDGLLYIFVNGTPVGTGIDLSKFVVFQ